MSRRLNILITHECSGEMRRAWLALGHNVYSCDLLPAADGEIERHWVCDADKAMRFGCPITTASGHLIRFERWHLVITHRVCRYLANSGSLRLYLGGKKSNGPDLDRWRKMLEGAEDFRRQFLIGEHQGPLCAENPVMHRHAREIIDIHGIASANDCKITIQTVQPYMFGDDASKATQLWLRDLPELVIPPKSAWYPPRWVCPECIGIWFGAKADPLIHPKNGKRYCPNISCRHAPLRPRWNNQTNSGQNRLAPSAERAAVRAITYPGIARACAEQWLRYLLSK